MMMEKRNPGIEAGAPKTNAFGGAKDIGDKYNLPTNPATDDIAAFRSLGELSRDVLITCFASKYRIRPALGAVVFELSQHGRAA